MAYVTQSDLTERFGSVELAQLTDETEAYNTDDGEITKACDEASSLIDSYLSVRYAVPLLPVPTLIRKLACDIARYMLWKDRASEGSAVLRAYEDALARLRDIASGKAGLPDVTGVLPTPIGGLAYSIPTPVFNTDGLLDA